MNKHKSLISSKCLTQACTNLNIPWTQHDKNGNFICVETDKPYFFVNHTTPFNDESISKICRDKEFAYKLLGKKVRMPKTIGYFDPKHRNKEYRKYVQYQTHTAIMQDVVKNFGLPVIIKMNAGAMGQNVFLCQSRTEVRTAIKEVFRKDSPLYDFVAIAQKYVPIQKEYRVVIYKKEIILIYEKDFSNAKFVGNLSPFHQENSKAVLITDKNIIDNISNFVRPIFSSMNVQFAGLDILLDNKNQYVLLELNTKPGFGYFVRDSGEEHLVRMYEKILNNLH